MRGYRPAPVRPRTGGLTVTRSPKAAVAVDAGAYAAYVRDLRQELLEHVAAA
jgi:hypothetical protein